jgi:Domain of Unknown Function (DUF1259)
MVRRFSLAFALASLVAATATFAQTPADTAAISAALGRPGTAMPGGVYRVGLPRTDLEVTLDGVRLRPGFALGSYAAFEPVSGKTLVVGDLCLLEREIEPVMAQLQKDGIEVTALHNHLRNESPHVMYLHFLGVGDATALAQALRRALQMSGTPLSAPAPAASPQPLAFAPQVQQIVGHTGMTTGGVLSISVPRSDRVTVRGMTVTPGMGVTNVMNFEDAGNGRVATTGDFVLIASEVESTVAALRGHGFEVTAMHQHMIGDDPTLYYIHWWRVGSSEEVAGGLRDALSHIHTVS